MLGAHKLQVDLSHAGSERFAGIFGKLLRTYNIKKILERKDGMRSPFVMPASSPERHFPQEMLIGIVYDHGRLAFCKVSSHESHFLQAADMVGVGMGRQDVPDVRRIDTQFRQGFGAPRAAVYQKMVFTLDDEKVGLVLAFGKSAPHAYKKELKCAGVGKSHFAFFCCLNLHSEPNGSWFSHLQT